MRADVVLAVTLCSQATLLIIIGMASYSFVRVYRLQLIVRRLLFIVPTRAL